MFWVIQRNIQNEPAFDRLIEQLDRTETAYQVVDIIPFAHTMVPDVDQSGLVFPVGAYTVEKISKRKRWIPGYFNENLSYDILLNKYGTLMLNADATIGTFDNIKLPAREFFIRPVADSKQFSGKVMTQPEFEQWRDQIVAIGKHETSTSNISFEDRIVVARLTQIYSEYRFFCIDRKVITGSQYKLGDRIVYSTNTDYDANWLAWWVCDQGWVPNRAFALDIAITPDGAKIIEINAINSAGFYALDMNKFVHAINQMTF